MGKKASGILWLIFFTSIILCATFLASVPSGAAVGSWSSNGPALKPLYSYSTVGQIRGMALHPDFAITPKIFAGSDAGYLYISSDGGGSWTYLNMNSPDSWSGTYMQAVAVASDNQTVFVCSWGGNRIFKSTDCGNSWTSLVAEQCLSCSLSPNFTQDPTIFVTGNFGVKRSTDGGSTWATKTNGLKSWYYEAIVVSPNYLDDNTVFVVGVPGIYKSTDKGETWVCKNGSLPPTPGNDDGHQVLMPSVRYVVVSPNYSHDHTLFIVVGNQGVFKSTDGGDSWTCVNTDIKGVTSMGGMAISPNYVNDGALMLESYYDKTVLFSWDRGNNWVKLPVLPDTVISPGPVAFSPNFAQDQTIFIGVDGAVHSNSVFSYTFPPPANRPPTANAGPDQTKHAGQLVTLDGTASSDPDGDSITYNWSFRARPAGSAAALNAPTAAQPTFTLDRSGEYRLSLVVTDAKGAASAPDEVIISTTNSAPVANAGPDQTFEGVGMTVVLDGSKSSDPDLDGITYQWTMTTKPTGSAAQLSGADTVSPSFVVDKPGDYTVNLVVKDTWEAASNTATVKISSNNLKPVANAGLPLTVHVGTLVTLDGSGSTDPDHNYPLGYAWSFTQTPSGSTASLAGADTVSPAFTPDKEGGYIVQLVVTDSLGAVSPAATVTISTSNSTPIANAGANQSISKIGVTVTLDGTASRDPDGDLLAYQWSLTSHPAGSTATLNGDQTPNPTFTADVHGDYVAQLTVTDPWGATSSATVLVSFTNLAPVASAGPNQVAQAVGATINLDGSASYDDNGDSLTYAWSLAAQPGGSIAQIISDPDNPAKASFEIDVHGDYVAELLVKDPLNASATAQARISFNNLPPVADAGPSQSVKVGNFVTLDGSHSSDPNGDSLTYAWSLISRPTGSSASLSGANSGLASLLPDMAGVYVITLTVNDGFGGTASTNIQVQAFLNSQTVTAAIQQLEAIITDQVALPDNVFKNPNMRKTMTNKLNSVIANIEAKNYQEALAQLENDLLQKTDGFYGGNPKNDWITTQAAQEQLYPALAEIIKDLRNLR